MVAGNPHEYWLSVVVSPFRSPVCSPVLVSVPTSGGRFTVSAADPAGCYGGVMCAEHFDPWGNPRPCWHCTHFDRIEPAGCGLCLRPGATRRKAAPADGCAFWEREVGADDEPDWVPEFVSTTPRGAQVWKARVAPSEPKPIRQPVRWAP